MFVVFRLLYLHNQPSGMQNRIFSDIILYIFTDAGEDEFEEEEEDGLEDGKC